MQRTNSKRFIQNFIAFLTIMLVPLYSSAEEVTVNGIKYNTSIQDGEYIATVAENKVSGYITIPSQITVKYKSYTVIGLENYAFYSCSDLKRVNLPNTIKKIGKSSFMSCTNLEVFNFPSSVTSIGENAFALCESLTSIEVPDAVTSIGNGAFGACSHLSQIKLPNNMESIPTQLFDGCYQLKDIQIPASVKSIEDYAFRTCLSLTNIELPASVTNIGKYAFYECRVLTSIEIPELVQTIGERAFGNCDSLSRVNSLATTPPTLGTNVFYNSPTLGVLPGRVNAYRNSDWAQYCSEIVELPSSIRVDVEGNGKVFCNTFDAVVSGTRYEGNDFNLFIFPDDDNRIVSIILDYRNITANLNGHYITIPEYSGYGTLKVEFAPEGEATLTVKGADNHSFTHIYNEGTRAKIALNPEDGWEIHSVTFNDEEVTYQLESNYTFISEPLFGDNNLNLVLKSELSDIETIENEEDQVKISVYGNTVTIQGLDNDDTVSVYDLEGRIVYTGYERTLTLKQGMVYLLTAQSKTFKIAI